MGTVRNIGVSVAVTACVVAAGGQVAYASPARTRTVWASTGSGDSGTTAGQFAISGNGRYVVFASAAALVPGDTNDADDIYLRDRKTGTTTQVSVSSSGAAGDGASDDPTISRDGRYVAFTSYAANLVAGDTDGFSDVFVRDLKTGTTTRVNTAGQDQDLWNATISGNGRYVSFSTPAPLVAGDDNGVEDVFVNDLSTGETTLASVPAQAGAVSDGGSYWQSISADGRYVAFNSWSTTLVDGDTNNTVDAFLRDRAAGTTQRVSVSSAGQQFTGSSYGTSVSDDGRYVAFTTDGADFIGDINVRDVQQGTTTAVNVSPTGERANENGADPQLSADGRYVTFGSFATNLVTNDTNGWYDIFVRDLQSGTTSLASVATDGTQRPYGGDNARISADGHHIAFDSTSGYVPGDTNDQEDVYVRDLG